MGIGAAVLRTNPIGLRRNNGAPAAGITLPFNRLPGLRIFKRALLGRQCRCKFAARELDIRLGDKACGCTVCGSGCGLAKADATGRFAHAAAAAAAGDKQHPQRANDKTCVTHEIPLSSRPQADARSEQQQGVTDGILQRLLTRISGL